MSFVTKLVKTRDRSTAFCCVVKNRISVYLKPCGHSFCRTFLSKVLSFWVKGQKSVQARGLFSVPPPQLCSVMKQGLLHAKMVGHSLFLALLVSLGLVWTGVRCDGAPLCVPPGDRCCDDPPGWQANWGYSSSGNYNAAYCNPGFSSSSSGVYEMCISGGCGVACCWVANGFSFYVVLPSNSAVTCNVNLNFNGDSRNYVAVVSGQGGHTVRINGNLGFMYAEGNWVSWSINCGADILQLWQPNQKAEWDLHIKYQLCGGIPQPLCTWRPWMPDWQCRAWTAFDTSGRCPRSMLEAAGVNGTELDTMDQQFWDEIESTYNPYLNYTVEDYPTPSPVEVLPEVPEQPSSNETV